MSALWITLSYSNPQTTWRLLHDSFLSGQWRVFSQLSDECIWSGWRGQMFLFFIQLFCQLEWTSPPAGAEIYKAFSLQQCPPAHPEEQSDVPKVFKAVTAPKRLFGQIPPWSTTSLWGKDLHDSLNWDQRFVSPGSGEQTEGKAECGYKLLHLLQKNLEGQLQWGLGSGGRGGLDDHMMLKRIFLKLSHHWKLTRVRSEHVKHANLKCLCCDKEMWDV